MKKSINWFTNRINKIVYRNKTSCKCDICQRAYNGLLITNEMHANYLYDLCGDYNSEGAPLEYFDTIEERDRFELTISERCPNHYNGQETDDNSTSDTKA